MQNKKAQINIYLREGVKLKNSDAAQCWQDANWIVSFKKTKRRITTWYRNQTSGHFSQKKKKKGKIGSTKETSYKCSEQLYAQ